MNLKFEKMINIRNIVLAALLAVSVTCGYAASVNDELITVPPGQLDTAAKAREFKQKQSASSCRNEISFWGAGGWSSLYYRTSVGEKSKLPLGGEAGLGYTFYFSPYVGLMLGAELAYYQNKISFYGVYDNYDTQEHNPYLANDPKNINYRYRMDNYVETQSLWALNIPLMLQFQTARHGHHSVYFGLGAKLGIPLSGKYFGSHGTVTSMGYYYDYDQTVKEEKSQLGYGSFDNQTTGEGKLKLGLAITGTVEVGMKWYLGKNVNLYTGAYGEYAFNDILKDNRHKQFVELDSYVPEAGTFHVNSVLHSQYNNGVRDLKKPSVAGDGTTQAFAKKLAPAAVGIKLRFGFGIGCAAPDNGKNSKKADDRHLEAARLAAVAAAAKRDTTIVVVNVNHNNENDDDPYGRKAARRQRNADYDYNNGYNYYDYENNALPRNSKYREVYANDPAALQEIEDYLAASRRRRNSSEQQQHLGKINYNLNIVQLTPEQEKTLNGYIAQMQANPDLRVNITGHACNLGSYELNMWFGQERADIAKEYMVLHGIRPSRIYTNSKGDTQPLVPNTSEANRKKNRRLEIRLIR